MKEIMVSEEGHIFRSYGKAPGGKGQAMGPKWRQGPATHRGARGWQCVLEPQAVLMEVNAFLLNE